MSELYKRLSQGQPAGAVVAYRAKLSENLERQRKLARQRADDIHVITNGLIEIKRKLAAAGLQVALQDKSIQDRIAKPKLVRVIIVVTGASLTGILFGRTDTTALGDGGPLYGRNLSYSARGIISADRSEQHRRRGLHLQDSSGLDEREPRGHSGQGLRQWRIAHGLNGYWPVRLIEPGEWRSAPGFGDNDYHRATSFDEKWRTEN
jgi:hypothetical protein